MTTLSKSLNCKIENTIDCLVISSMYPFKCGLDSFSYANHIEYFVVDDG